MGDDADQRPPTDDADDSGADDDARIDVGRVVLDELSAIKGMGADKPVDRGPRPRSLSQARIKAKSDVDAPRVRSNRLRPLRHVRTGPRPLLQINTPDNAPGVSPRDPENHTATEPLIPGIGDDDETQKGTPVVTAALGRQRLLPPLQVVGVLLLLETALLPSLRAKTLVAPWSAWTDPASPNFVAVAFLALLGIFFAFPVSRLLRTALHGLVGALLVAFSLVLLRSALESGAFDGQPALHALFGDGLIGGLVVLSAVCILPTALLWCHVAPESRGARLTVTGGVIMVLFSYVGLQAVTALQGSPIGHLVNAGSEGAFLGDRIAAGLAWLPLVASLASLVVWMPGNKSALAGPLGILVWVTAMLPMATLALYVAPVERWHEVLVPLQIVSLLAAGLLLLAACLGHVLAVRQVGEL